jgi:hypothetical protein
MYQPLSFDRNKRMRAGQRQQVECELVARGLPCGKKLVRIALGQAGYYQANYPITKTHPGCTNKWHQEKKNKCRAETKNAHRTSANNFLHTLHPVYI